jgi:CheY-like chemotaxis protein
MRVLLVEDDEGIRECVAEVLDGHRVDTAANGLEALRLIEAGNQYDAMLLDLLMPVMGGQELLEELESRGIAMPTVIMTAQSKPSVVGRHLLHKPFEIEGLLAALEHCRRSVTGEHEHPPLASGRPQEEVLSR